MVLLDNIKHLTINTLLLDNALATMGAGLPSAIMLSILYPTKQIMAVCGDGGFMMNSQELETAKRLKVNLVVLVILDNAYGMIRWKQKSMNLEYYAMEFTNPNFVKYAESYGIRGHSIKKAQDLIPTINNAFSESGIHVIEVPIDYSENDKL